MKKKQKMVAVQLELSNEVLLELCLMAHESDMTLNAFVNKILKEYIDQKNLERKQTEHGIIK
jgi:predicted HicB family RNase H-like nuclease